MKYTLLIFFFIISVLTGSAWAKETSAPAIVTTENVDDQNDLTMNTTIRIKVGNQTFTATLFDTEAANAFKALLPLTVNMKELNNNEKFYQLPQSLPVNASNPGTITKGDLMLWGSNTVVLFYQTFSTSYRYTKLGKIDNPTGLTQALGAGDVMVTFEME